MDWSKFFISENYTGIIAAIDENDVWVQIGDYPLHSLFKVNYHIHIDDKDIDRDLSKYRLAIEERNKRQAREEDQTEYSIYALIDPSDKNVFWVGMTENLERRYLQHTTTHSTNPDKDARIDNILAQGLEPELILLETVKALKRERHWIRFYLSQGANLANIDRMEVVE